VDGREFSVQDFSTKWLERIATLPSRYVRPVGSVRFIPQIDGLRFLALYQVLFFHAALRGQRAFDSSIATNKGLSAWLSHGTAGVELFFFISGFIVSAPFIAGKSVNWSDFVWKRISRIHPPYFITLVIFFVALLIYTPGPEAQAFHHDTSPLWQSFAASCFYLHGLIFNVSPRINPPLWSLEIEMQFYLIFPAIIYSYLLIKNFFVRIIFSAIVILLSGIFHAGAGVLWKGFDYTVISYFYMFVSGMAVCDIVNRFDFMNRADSVLFDVFCLIGFLGFIGGGIFYNASKVDTLLYFGGFMFRMSAIILLFFGAIRGRISRKIFAIPWLAFLGSACYSIYLTHVPLMQLLAVLFAKIFPPTSQFNAWLWGWVLLIPCVTACGVIFHIYVERVFMDHRWPKIFWNKYLS